MLDATTWTHERDNMSFDMTKMEYIHTIWYVGCDEKDWMAMLFKEEGRWCFRYRFRYNAEPGTGSPFDERDKKNWYEFAESDDMKSDPDVLAKLSTTASTVAFMTSQTMGGAELFELPVHGGHDIAMEILSRQPWCHMRFERPDGTVIPEAPAGHA